MQDPYLPPGCSQTDIDLALGALTRCIQCGRPCQPREDEEDAVCQRCLRAEAQADEEREPRQYNEDDWREDR